MINEIFNVMECFPRSYINHRGEVILSDKGNIYFNALKCESKEDIQCSLLEWCTKQIVDGCFYRHDKENDQYKAFLLQGLNNYLHTDFTKDDVCQIYERLGNGINHPLTEDFIQNNFDMSVLNNENEKMDLRSDEIADANDYQHANDNHDYDYEIHNLVYLSNISITFLDIFYI